MSVDHTPRRLRRLCWALAVLVVVVFGVLTVLLGHSTADGRKVGIGDQVGFFGIGVLIALGALALTRFRVRADEHGVWVRNTVGERYFPWAVVVSVELPEGATWAQLELHDDETVGLLAVQTSDGDAAIDVVIALRRLLKASRDA